MCLTPNPNLTNVFSQQVSSLHVAVVKAPRLQELRPDTMYPSSHVGWHDDPLGSELVQLPTPPFSGAEEMLQGAGSHVAVVKVPRLQELRPDTMYPLSQVGWHVEPLARELVQSPAAPFAGAADALHGFAEHVAAVNVPKEQDDVPDTVYPELHVGWHVDPL